MDKTSKILALTFIFSIVLGGYAFAQTGDLPPYLPYGVAGSPSFEASHLVGYRVWGPGDYDLGQISDLAIDQDNGRVALVILSGVPGFGAGKLAIPYAMLTQSGDTGFSITFQERAPIDFSASNPTPYRHAMAPGEIRGAIDPAFVESVYAGFGADPYWTKGENPITVVYTMEKFMGAECDLVQGGTAGKVDDFVIDSSDGHVALVVLSDVAGAAGKMIAVPFNLVSLKDRNVFALNISGDKLQSAPAFNEFTDTGNRQYTENIYRYFGVRPYWTEGEMR